MSQKFLLDEVTDDATIIQAIRKVVNITGSGGITISYDPDTGELSFAGSGGGGGGGVGAYAYIIGDGSTSYTTTSSSFGDLSGISVDVPAADGDRLQLTFDCTSTHSVDSEYIAFTFNVGGTDLSIAQVHSAEAGGNSSARTLIYPHTVSSGEISGGLVTVQMRWKTSAATATVLNESSGLKRKPVLTVMNVGP